MGKPDYIAPQTVDEALETLAKQSSGAKIIAGGTDLLPRMRSGIMNPALLVDLCRLPLNHIEIKSGWLHIGARVTHSEILGSELLAVHCPALVEAAKAIAGPPIRNRGTIGGNIINASPAADLAPPLLVYDAIVLLVKADAERVVPLAELFIGPGRTILSSDEILTEIRVPLPPPDTASNFVKLGKRRAMAIAVASAATRLTLDGDGIIFLARVALGSLAPKPMRSIGAESLLQGKAPGMEIFTEAARVASLESSPITDLRASAEYRKKMVAVLVRRSLDATWGQLGMENQCRK